jgi:hypothetical protein
MDLSGAIDLAEVSTFRKAAPPTLGPAFGHSTYDPNLVQMPGGATLMFDLSKLTLADMRAMRYHPQINASLSLITFMIHQVDWHIECEDKRIADAVEENLRRIWTRLIRAIGQAFWAGFSPNVLEWENDSNGKYFFINKVKDLVPEECQVNWLEVESAYRPPRDPNNPSGHQIIPKVKIYDGIKKVGLNFPIPPDLSLWYPIFMENGNYYGKQLLKPAFTPWYFSILIHLFSNRYFERFGEPLPIGRAPFEDEYRYKLADGSVASMSSKQAMENILMSIRNRGIVVLPSDRDETASSSGGRSEYTYDIEYLESQMRGADFERYMARLDEEISLSLFTPTLLMRAGDIGSHNLGVQHTQTFLWNLNAITGDMKEYIDRYICERIKAYNFSEKAPRCEWIPRKMGKDNPETLRAIIAGLISRTSDRFVMPDLNELGVQLGMKLEEIEVVVEPPAAPGAAGGTDTRDRSERARGGGGPRRVGEPLATGRQIAARIKGQVANNWDSGKWEKANLSMGFRRRFEESLITEGWDEHTAAMATSDLYGRMESWVQTIQSLGTSEFSSQQDFLDMFDRKLTSEIERLAAQ